MMAAVEPAGPPPITSTSQRPGAGVDAACGRFNDGCDGLDAASGGLDGTRAGLDAAGGGLDGTRAGLDAAGGGLNITSREGIYPAKKVSKPGPRWLSGELRPDRVKLNVPTNTGPTSVKYQSCTF